MKDMMAVKSFRYASRALQPGDTFSAKDRDARLLVAVKKAVAAPVAAEPEDAEAASDGASAAGDELDALRGQYKVLFGKAAYHGWDEAALREKIAAFETDVASREEN
ncbi:hypothetical protein [Sinorhizobium fredii]|uniref:hypothetical protein n=1 Tax=Rhizobium fredii TaxID=380 RepID=UPI0004B575A0|nr:hypothetical protein [Sinorhizobium fredii]ASY68885.1 hypothetical protein SF83666_c14640 [Sinorhizobium fredii CCBAU 83666]